MNQAPPTTTVGFFDLIEQHGNWAFLKLIARMVAFLLLQMIRLVLLFVLRVIEGVMHRVDIARPLPAPPKPPPDTRDTSTPAAPLGEDLAYAA